MSTMFPRKNKEEESSFPGVRKLVESVMGEDYSDQFYLDLWQLIVMQSILDEFSDSDDYSELLDTYQDDFDYQSKKKKGNK